MHYRRLRRPEGPGAQHLVDVVGGGLVLERERMGVVARRRVAVPEPVLGAKQVSRTLPPRAGRTPSH
jgi:hypothetical protein